MTMRTLASTVIGLLVLSASSPAQEPPAQEVVKAPEPLFVRLTVYPTASLSRYDFNNDLDLYEVRAYLELRRGSQDGNPIDDARVTALGERLDYHVDHYDKRIMVDKGRLPDRFDLEIVPRDRPAIRENFELPAWLILTDPKPSIYEPGQDVLVRWRFTRFQAPVDVHAYDFKTGREFFLRDNAAATEVLVPAPDLPASTIVRVYIIQSWLYKRFLGGPAYARGSEVNIIPWSQVFIRTK